MIDKLPPQNIEAEQSLLGCLMIDKNAIVKVVDFLQSKDFYKGIHQEIYDSCLDLFEKGEPIDFLSVSGKLKDKDLLEQIGGNAYLTDLINCVPTATHVLNYAKTVQKKRVLRDLISASQELEGMGYNEDEDINVLLDEAEKKIFSIAQKGFTSQFIPVKEDLENALQRLHNLKEGGSVRGISTGFKNLDNMLSGFQRADLIILAARPSMGKSALAVNFAANIAIQQNIPVGIFSLEMSRDQIADRLISSVSGIDSWKLRTGHISEEEDMSRIQEAIATLDKAPIYIDDSSATNVLQMKAMARRLQMDKGLGLVIIDYLQLMDSLSADPDPVHQVSANSKALKGMAKELNVPVLVLSQLSRAVEQRTPPRPRLADLRQSGAIEQDADVVMFIYREDKAARYDTDSTVEKGTAQILIEKHRNGPTGTADLFFHEGTMTFKDAEKRYTEESFM